MQQSGVQGLRHCAKSFGVIRGVELHRISDHESEDNRKLHQTAAQAGAFDPVSDCNCGDRFGARAQSVKLKFDFGPGELAAGYTRVMASDVYTKERGYGFEPGANISCLDRGGLDTLRADFCASDQPFYFSVALPEGNYTVDVTLGDAQRETITTVKAELRRLMVERAVTARGQFATRTFTVNIRTPWISGGNGPVQLKDRERTSEWWAWDEKLTMEFNNVHPSVCAIEITRAIGPTLYLLGDSTVCDQPLEPYNSWGQMLTRFLKPGIAVANHAESGESLRSSLAARRLEKVLSTLRTGDYVMIQYGHNDEKEKGEKVGAFTSFKKDLKKFITEIRGRGGIPILVTPVQRRTFDAAGKITNSHGDYPEAVRQVAREEIVPLIDLNAMSKELYEAWGPELSKRAFAPNDNTHPNSYGSYELAKCIIEGIKQANTGLVTYLSVEVAPFDPRRPDPVDSFSVPASPAASIVKPVGN